MNFAIRNTKTGQKLGEIKARDAEQAVVVWCDGHPGDRRADMIAFPRADRNDERRVPVR